MLKIRMTVCGFLFAVFVSAGGAVFAASPAEQQALALFANQPPLAQADIDAFVKITPRIAATANDPAAVIKLYQDNGVSPERFALVSSKISVGAMMSQGMTREQLAATGQFPEALLPSGAEADLIKKNMDAIGKAMGMPTR